MSTKFFDFVCWLHEGIPNEYCYDWLAEHLLGEALEMECARYNRRPLDLREKVRLLQSQLAHKITTRMGA